MMTPFDAQMMTPFDALSLQQAMQQSAYGPQQQMSGLQQMGQRQQWTSGSGIYIPINQPTKEEPMKDELLPDISITRAIKWAIVLLIALSLGQKVWDKLGPKISAQLHKALGCD